MILVAISSKILWCMSSMALMITPARSDLRKTAFMRRTSSCPCACATRPVVPMRRKENIQYIMLKMVVPRATVPM